VDWSTRLTMLNGPRGSGGLVLWTALNILLLTEDIEEAVNWSRMLPMLREDIFDPVD